MVTKLSLSCLLVNEMFVVRRQSQSRPSQWMVVVQVGVKMDIWARRRCQNHQDNCPLSSGCAIYAKRLLDMVQGSESDESEPLAKLSVFWAYSTLGEVSPRHKKRNTLLVDRWSTWSSAWVGWERPWTSHLLICSWHHETDSFWRETRTTVTLCDTSVCTTF